MRILRWLFLLFLTSLASAQFTTVTGTVLDPNSVPYANGTITAQLVLSGTTPTINGGSFSMTGSAGLDKTGSFIMRLADSLVMSPNANWSFTVCSSGGTVQPAGGTGPQCFTPAPITITGASQSITAQLHAAALALTFGGSSFTAAHDLSGTSASQTVVGIQGNPVNAGTLARIGQSFESHDGSTLTITDSPMIKVQDYGAVPDGATDNAAAFAAAFTAANSVTIGFPTVYFGCNGASSTCEYNYSGAGTSAINPAIPMTIQCAPGVLLNYTGTAHAVDLTTSTAFPNLRPYTIKGCAFTGGATYTAGIFLQAGASNAANIGFFVAEDNLFYNFGNSTAATINSTGNNWTVTLQGNYWLNYDGTNRMMVDAHTATNSYYYITNNYSACSQANGTACSSAGPVVGFWIRDAWIAQNQFLGPEPIIRVASGSGGGGGGMWVVNNEFELNSNSPKPFITYGDPGGTAATVGTVHMLHNSFQDASAPQAGVSIIAGETPAAGSYNASSWTLWDNFFPSPGAGAFTFDTGGGTLNLIIGNHGPGFTSDMDFGTAGYFGTNQAKEQEFYIPYRQHSQAAGPLVDSPLAMDASGPHYMSTANYHGMAKPIVCNDSSGSATAQNCSTNPTFNSQGSGVCAAAGDTIYYKTTTANTGALTLTVNSGGACSPVAVQKWGGSALTGGEIVAGKYYVMTFDGTAWQLPILGTAGPFGTSQLNVGNPCETAGAPTTLSTVATTTDTGLACLPGNAVIDAVVYRITTTITTAASFQIGDATTVGRFCGAQSTLLAGTTGICFVQADQTGAAGPRQTTSVAVRVTTNVNPGAGAIRLIVYYHTWVPPTS